ncbi:hypothetical protein BX600DRAFT_228850 [Xylariales sp. PMI_506]|nr:hypothetical protein BX600DRAFT_228850 [Xylariales sp. PMI_506]
MAETQGVENKKSTRIKRNASPVARFDQRRGPSDAPFNATPSIKASKGSYAAGPGSPSLVSQSISSDRRLTQLVYLILLGYFLSPSLPVVSSLLARSLLSIDASSLRPSTSDLGGRADRGRERERKKERKREVAKAEKGPFVQLLLAHPALRSRLKPGDC